MENFLCNPEVILVIEATAVVVDTAVIIISILW